MESPVVVVVVVVVADRIVVVEGNLNNSAEVDSCYSLGPAEIGYVGIDPAGIGSVGIGSCCCYCSWDA